MNSKAQALSSIHVFNTGLSRQLFRLLLILKLFRVKILKSFCSVFARKVTVHRHSGFQRVADVAQHNLICSATKRGVEGSCGKGECERQEALVGQHEGEINAIELLAEGFDY